MCTLWRKREQMLNFVICLLQEFRYYQSCSLDQRIPNSVCDAFSFHGRVFQPLRGFVKYVETQAAWVAGPLFSLYVKQTYF